VRKLLLILLVLIPIQAIASTSYYFDPTAAGGGNGSYATPWNSMSQVSSHSFSTGDDLYFKKNETYQLQSDTDYLDVDWGGTESDPVVIGCYDGDGDFDCGSTPYVDGNRAIIDGQKSYPTINYRALVQTNGQSHIIIQQLKLENAGITGTQAAGAVYINPDSVSQSTDITIKNNYCYRNSGGIGVYRSTNCLVTENYETNVGYPDYGGSGAAIEISSLDHLGDCNNNTVSKNLIENCKNEGIGFYKGAENNIMEYNVVRNIRAAHLYVASSPSNTVRYNLVYDTSDGLFTQDGTSSSGIVVDIEEWRDAKAFNTNDEKIYGNLVAGVRRGISIGCIEATDGDSYTSTCYDGSEVFNNTIVDCTDQNFAFWAADSSRTITLKNNLSVILSGGAQVFCASTTGTCPSQTSPAGVTWDHNLFNTTVTGNASNNAVIGDPLLAKTSGWQWSSLSPGDLSGPEFKPQSGSPAIDAGLNIAGYTSQITGANFNASPISVTLTDYPDGPVWIGAWNITPTPPPTPAPATQHTGVGYDPHGGGIGYNPNGGTIGATQ